MSSKPVSLPSQNKSATISEKNLETKTVTLAKTTMNNSVKVNSNNNSETAAIYDELLPKIDQLFYTDPARGKHNNVSSKIRSVKDSQFNITFQTTRDDNTKQEPKCRMPFAITEPFDNKNDKTGLKDLNLSIETSGLEMFLKKLDENNIRVAHANSQKWFKKQLTIEQVRDMYKPTIRYDTKAEEKKRQAYKPTIKTRVAVDAADKSRCVRILEYVGQHPTDPTKKIFKNYRGSWKTIEKHTQAIAIVEISSLWFMPKEFGMSLRTVGLILYPVNKNTPSFNMGTGQNCVIMDDSEVTPAPQEPGSPPDSGAPAAEKNEKIVVVKQD